MIHHAGGPPRHQARLLVADMPFGSYHSDTAESLRNAVRFVKEAGVEAVKVEGGERRLETIARLTEAEIPVMGHRPHAAIRQRSRRLSRARQTTDGAEQLLRDARAVAAAAPSPSFEAVPANSPRKSRASCGSHHRHRGRPGCDGQILVVHEHARLAFDQTPNSRVNTPTSAK